jgi:hypothetical protein
LKILIENPKTDQSNLDPEISEDFTGMRIITVDDEYTFKLRSQDPTGFFKISMKGALPVELQGEFTSTTDAIIAIRAYINRKRAEAVKPSVDKNIRKVQEILRQKDATSD